MISNQNYSNMSGVDLSAINAQIAEAQKNYQKYLDDYNWGMMEGSSSYAKRVRWPRVVAAQQVVDSLISHRDQLLNSDKLEQSIDIVDETIKVSKEAAVSSIPWGTIGIVAVCLIFIVIIYKFI